MNQNRIQPNLEEKLEQLIAKNDQIVSISKQAEHKEEASSISSLNFFCPDERLRHRMDRIPTYVVPSNEYRYS